MRHKIKESLRSYPIEIQVNKEVEESLKVLPLIKKLCQKHNAEFAVFSTNVDIQFESLSEYLKDKEIPFFDIYELYSMNPHLFHPNDRHWSRNGTIYIAEWLSNHLRKTFIP